MSNDLRQATKDLKDLILEEMRRAHGVAFLERLLHLRFMGTMDEPDGYGRVTGSCGDTIEIFFRFENDRIKDASFQTDGCGSTAVCASLAAEMAHGKNPDELLEITSDAILERLGGLPKKNEHCASLAVNTLQEALNDYMIKQIKSAKRKGL
jgi:nitrogen fixation NifU-like protein